jgi:general secretion pathway protein D
LVAKPQLRGQEGQTMTLNLGEDIPVPTTSFTPIAGGGAAVNPLTSFGYRSVGVIVEVTPRVTFENEIILDLTVENSTLGPSISVAGTSLPTFGSRKVQTRLRLRDGESNLLAGLLREEDRETLRGLPGLLRVPLLRSLFGDTEESIRQTDIVMLLTPRIVRTHELTQRDVDPIYVGTQAHLTLTGPPALIAPPLEPGPPPPSAGLDPDTTAEPAELTSPVPTPPAGSADTPGTVTPPPEPSGPAPDTATEPATRPPAIDLARSTQAHPLALRPCAPAAVREYANRGGHRAGDLAHATRRATAVITTRQAEETGLGALPHQGWGGR